MLRSPLSSPLRHPLQSPLAARRGGGVDPYSMVFDLSGTWANFGSSGTHSHSVGVSNVDYGNSSLTLTQSATGNTRRTKFLGATGLDLSAIDAFYVWVYFPTNRVGSNSLNVYFSTGASGNYANSSLIVGGGAVTGTQVKGWNLWRLPKSSFSIAGGTGVDWSNVNNVQFFLNAGGGADTCTIGLLGALSARQPRIAMTFDDNHETQFSAAQTAISYGIPVTLYVIPDLVNGAGYLTTAQLTTLRDAGHLIAGHHQTELTTLPSGGQSTVAGVQSWLESNGFGAGALHFAYPGGKYNSDVLSAMSNLGMISARTISGIPASGPNDASIASYSFQNRAGRQAHNKYALNSVNLANTLSLANAISAVNTAIANQIDLIFYAHLFGTGATGDQWDTGDFSTLCAHIQSSGIPAVTMAQMAAGMSTPPPP
jgi:hypothetical protein